MRRLLYRNPLLAIAILAGFYIYNNYIKQPTLNVSLNEKQMKICVSKDNERKKHCFDLPEFFVSGNVSLKVQNGEIFVHYSNDKVSTIDTKWEFNKRSNKLFLRKFVGRFPDRQDHYGVDNVCSIDNANIFIGDIDEDRFVDSMTSCRYEYADLPPLQELSEDFAKMSKGLDELYEYSHYDYAKRYDAIFRTYPLSDATHVLYNNIGYYLEQAEAYDAAIYVLNTVLEKYPQRAVAHLNIADAYWGNGERGKARKHYEEYLRLMKDQKKDESKIPQTVYDRMKPAPPFTDSRDGQQYRIVEIDKQTWMAENLNYRPSDGSGWCYERSVDNCTKYGRLYDWNTALKACPTGWHLPSVQEWDDLMRTVGGDRKQYKDNYSNTSWGWYGVGKKLKAGNGWVDNGNGTDDYGFSALPGGVTDSEYFADVKYCGFWWTATASKADEAHHRDMVSNNGNVRESTSSKRNGFSVRCVQN